MPTPGRSLHLDNIKAVLIFLVVFGHLIEPNIAHDSAIKSVWLFLYSFHMPMFILVSGMLSRETLGEGQVRRLLRNIVAPLLAFEILYELLEVALTGSVSNYFHLFAPYWMLWYLLSLLCWRLLLPLFARLRYGLPIALLFALASSYSEDAGYFLSVTRTITFFPFFLLGWQAKEKLLLPASGKLTAACLALLAALFTAACLFHDFDYRILYGSYSLAALQMADAEGVAWQAGLYLLSAVGGLAFINLIPRRNVGIARIGERSIYSYLWHGAVVIAMSAGGLLGPIFELHGVAAMAVMAVVTAAILVVASHDVWVALTDRFILDPAARLLSRQADEPARQPRPAESRGLVSRS